MDLINGPNRRILIHTGKGLINGVPQWGALRYSTFELLG